MERKKYVWEILGILGVCLLMYSVSNYSVNFLLNFLNLEKPTVPIVFFNRTLLWGSLFLFFLYVKFYLKKDFLPWKERNLSFLKTVLSVIIVLVLLFVGFVALVLIIQNFNFPTQGERIEEITNLVYHNLPLMIFTCFTAAVVEELLFRGFILPAFTEITNSVWMGVVISSVLFGLMHLSYGTIHQVIIPIYFGIIFSVYYVKYRNLKVAIFCHFIWNLVANLDAAGLL